MKENRTPKRNYFKFILGLLVFLIGISMLSMLVFRKISRELHRQQLLKENPVIEIPDLNIKEPILEGTDHDILAEAIGHFTNTGDFGKGNYCLAGHSSTIYQYAFNQLEYVKEGMTVLLYDQNRKCYHYAVAESFIVKPDETWILDEFGDDRITLVTCTDDGEQRQIVIAYLKENEVMK